MTVRLLRQSGEGKSEFLNPNDLHVTAGYTHVVTANQGKMVFVSGQVALNKQLELVGKGDLRAQTTQVFENLRVALVAAVQRSLMSSS